VIVDEKGTKCSWKEYVEKLMNEENEWHQGISAGVKEVLADCIRNSEIAAAHTHMHTIILWLFWSLSGTTRMSWYQKCKTNLDLLEQERVSGSGICWAGHIQFCNFEKDKKT